MSTAPLSSLSLYQQSVYYTKEVAAQRMSVSQALAALSPAIKTTHAWLDTELTDEKSPILADGVSASLGLASGQIAFNLTQAQQIKKTGQEVVLVRNETEPEDIESMHLASAIITARGGLTSHAAVVARALSKPCLVNCKAIQIDYEQQCVWAQGTCLKVGDTVTVDANHGHVLLGQRASAQSATDPTLIVQKQLLTWLKTQALMPVRVYISTHEEAAFLAELGESHIGLCSFKHICLNQDILPYIQAFILCKEDAQKQQLMTQVTEKMVGLLGDLVDTARAVSMTISFFESSMLSLLPQHDNDFKKVAELLGVSSKSIKTRQKELTTHHTLSLKSQGIKQLRFDDRLWRLQILALFEYICLRRTKSSSLLQIQALIPGVTEPEEMTHFMSLYQHYQQHTLGLSHNNIGFSLGAMIDTPLFLLNAAALVAYFDLFMLDMDAIHAHLSGLPRDESDELIAYFNHQKKTQDCQLPGYLVTFNASQLKPLLDPLVLAIKAKVPKATLQILWEYIKLDESVRQVIDFGTESLVTRLLCLAQTYLLVQKHSS